ncbi:MAG: heme ABC exporter ATP-binding protein CcmA [Rhodospirillaceae bacterium]|nr:heme ABC exporter ATP-binding protein CcmA [Rhodospirillaceae bacterium]
MSGGERRFEAVDLSCIRGERPVFSGLSFDLASGDGLLLRGHNGSGKSSLLRILAGFLKPVGGSLGWSDFDRAETPEIHRARTHYVGHMEAIKPALTVEEHLEFWARAKGYKQPAGNILQALDLESLADVPGRFLSAGQKRRLSLTRLLATPATLWLLDEPSVTLDGQSAARLEDMLAAHRATGGMAIVASHTEIALPGAESIDMAEYGIAIETLVRTPQTAVGERDYGEW